MKTQTISDTAVQKATGRSLEQWFTILNKMGAPNLSHTEIARALRDTHHASDWWAQMITVEYERAIGRRKVGQTCRGDYQVSVTKTTAGNMNGALRAWQRLIASRKEFNGVA